MTCCATRLRRDWCFSPTWFGCCVRGLANLALRADRKRDFGPKNAPPAPIREDCGQVGSLREPPWLKTPCNDHAGRCRANRFLSSYRNWALVQKVKIRHFGLSLHVGDLAGARNLKKMRKVGFRVVPRLQSGNHLLVGQNQTGTKSGGIRHRPNLCFRTRFPFFEFPV
jgi:hypothetical protein